MALTKSRVSIYAAQTLTAGAGNTTSAWQDCTGVYEADLDILLTNGATGPTVAAQVQVQFASDYNAGSPTGPVVNLGGALVGSTSNSATASWSVRIPLGVSAFRVVAGSNTGQNVTLDVAYSKVTAL